MFGDSRLSVNLFFWVVPIIYLCYCILPGDYGIDEDMLFGWICFLPRMCVQFSSITQSCLTLCNPMNRSTPGLPVHHQLPESTQTHVYWVGDAVQPSHPLSSSPAFSLSQHQCFPMSQFFTLGDQSIGVSASASVLPLNIQDWFPLGLTGSIYLQSKGLSRVFSNTTVQKHQFFGAQLSLFYSPTLASIRDYWKNHSFD